MELVWVDWVIVAVVAASTLLSIINGFLRECLSLINWFLAFAVAKFFYYDLSQSSLMSSMQADFRVPASILILFVTTLLLGFLIIYQVVRLLRKADGVLSVTDRILGMCFGALRGIMIVCACLAACQLLFSIGFLSFVQKMPFWEKSAFIPEFNKVVFWFFDKINVGEIVTDVISNLGDHTQGADHALSSGGGGLIHAPDGGTSGADASSLSGAVTVGEDGKIEIDPSKINPEDVERILRESR